MSSSKPVQLRRHVHFAVADSEMHQRAIWERQQRLCVAAFQARQPVDAKLIDGVLNALCEIGLQFCRGDGHALQEEHEVGAVLVAVRVMHLPHQAQTVGVVARDDVGVHRHRRLELHQLERLLQPQQLDFEVDFFVQAHDIHA